MFSAISDPYLRLVLWAGFVALVLTAALALFIVVLRLTQRRQERRWRVFVAQWRPILLAVMMSPDCPPVLPRLRRSDHLRFLRLWVYLHESVRGAAAEGLNAVAVRLQIDQTARRRLRSRSRATRLQTILALGYLRDRQAWDALQRLANQDDSLVSLNAARALIQIDPFEGAACLTPLILSRRDWDVTRMAAFLMQAREAFWLQLVRRLPTMSADDLPRALRLADALRLKLPSRVARVLLQSEQPAEVVQVALRLVDAGALHDDVLQCLAHPHWRVREQAAHQLAQQATPADTPSLARLLEDPRWEVRLCAAQSLAQLPFLDNQDLAALQRPGGLGEDVLRQALAERAWA